MEQNQSAGKPERLLRQDETCRRAGIGPTTLYKLIKLKQFPPPIKLPDSAAVRWLESEVDAWIAARIAARNASENAIPGFEATSAGHDEEDKLEAAGVQRERRERRSSKRTAEAV